MTIAEFLRSQKSYLAELTKKERALLYSFFLFAFASPIFHVYTSTFLWRQSGDPSHLIAYHVGMYIGVSLGFFVNTLALRVLVAHRLYTIACILQGIVPVAIVTLVPQTRNLILLLGVVIGIAAGIYWANRNYFTSLMTRSKHRYSFITLEHGLGTIAAIVAPAAIGWFITLGEYFNAYTTSVAYQISVGVGFLLLLASGVAANRIVTSTTKQRAKRLILTNASPRWKTLRRMDFFNGLMQGADMIIPLLMILMLVGLEDAVGTLQTVASIAAALAMYVVGKQFRNVRQGPILWFWLAIMSALAVLIGVHFGALGVVLYSIFTGLINPFRTAAISSILYTTIDLEAPNERSLYLFDREVILNAGRVLGLILVGYGMSYSPELTLQLGLCATLLARLFFVIAASRVDTMNRAS